MAHIRHSRRCIPVARQRSARVDRAAKIDSTGANCAILAKAPLTYLFSGPWRGFRGQGGHGGMFPVRRRTRTALTPASEVAAGPLNRYGAFPSPFGKTCQTWRASVYADWRLRQIKIVLICTHSSRWVTRPLHRGNSLFEQQPLSRLVRVSSSLDVSNETPSLGFATGTRNVTDRPRRETNRLSGGPNSVFTPRVRIGPSASRSPRGLPRATEISHQGTLTEHHLHSLLLRSPGRNLTRGSFRRYHVFAVDRLDSASEVRANTIREGAKA
jgi:hypothetical protein